MVVGWGACHVLVATSYYKQVSVLYALDEHHTVVAQLLVQQVDELLAVVGSKVSAVVVLYLAVGNADDVAAQGEVVGSHVVAYRSGFQWSATFIYLVHVIAKYGGISHLAAR